MKKFEITDKVFYNSDIENNIGAIKNNNKINFITFFGKYFNVISHIVDKVSNLSAKCSDLVLFYSFKEKNYYLKNEDDFENKQITYFRRNINFLRNKTKQNFYNLSLFNYLSFLSEIEFFEFMTILLPTIFINFLALYFTPNIIISDSYKILHFFSNVENLNILASFDKRIVEFYEKISLNSINGVINRKINFTSFQIISQYNSPTYRQFLKKAYYNNILSKEDYNNLYLILKNNLILDKKISLYLKEDYLFSQDITSIANNNELITSSNYSRFFNFIAGVFYSVLPFMVGLSLLKPIRLILQLGLMERALMTIQNAGISRNKKAALLEETACSLKTLLQDDFDQNFFGKVIIYNKDRSYNLILDRPIPNDEKASLFGHIEHSPLSGIEEKRFGEYSSLFKLMKFVKLGDIHKLKPNGIILVQEKTFYNIFSINEFANSLWKKEIPLIQGSGSHPISCNYIVPNLNIVMHGEGRDITDYNLFRKKNSEINLILEDKIPITKKNLDSLLASYSKEQLLRLFLSNSEGLNNNLLELDTIDNLPIIECVDNNLVNRFTVFLQNKNMKFKNLNFIFNNKPNFFLKNTTKIFIEEGNLSRLFKLLETKQDLSLFEKLIKKIEDTIDKTVITAENLEIPQEIYFDTEQLIELDDLRNLIYIDTFLNESKYIHKKYSEPIIIGYEVKVDKWINYLIYNYFVRIPTNLLVPKAWNWQAISENLSLPNNYFFQVNEYD